ncbi:MAG: hypothetical protein ABI686_15095 [Acidobacteriota bacterium]
MIQTWIHTIETPNGSPASREMRSSVSLSVGLCANFDNADYQPKLGGLDRTKDEI